MEPHKSMVDCPFCFESSGHPARIIPATWWEPSWAEPDYVRKCPECDGTGLIEAEPRDLYDIEAEDFDGAREAF